MSISIDLSGHVALITGASSGIGEGITKMLAKAGAKIAGCGRTRTNDKKILQLKKEVEDLGSQLLYIQADVTDDKQLQILVSETMSHFGSIDILVSNAGMNVFKGAAECDTEAWEFNMDLNLKSHWMVSKLCRPYLEKSSNGTILIMTSNHSEATIPGCFPYNVAKTALVGLVRALAIEWGPLIRTVGIAPGYIETSGSKKWFSTFADPIAERERTKNMHPGGQLGTTEEVGAFCAFLVSSYASFATGSTYVMDGGRTALLQD
ncbi:SDR family NAD(P)-dependent oxidoreductase [Bacillus sp. SD088]|uniref:SDR family NAD(P)-dependent oxidoreductase n=1 Tax=Bacillus sp. SD088 TaxID=2782012 RepID=UPI001A96BF21|nr:SDR family oxidoreductase [Bacillus sp. SD088]MBO0991495.1 SDR family oxidoreductase [Bacillus sp. SD088]